MTITNTVKESESLIHITRLFGEFAEDEHIVQKQTEEIEILVQDSYAAILVDLHKLFGGTDYLFQAEIDPKDLIFADIDSKQGFLFLTAVQDCPESRIRVTVHATSFRGIVHFRHLNVVLKTVETASCCKTRIV
ncbi:hypothetical protein [Coraliomargarita parva]|uniref:hypothetical protein n=1 Tax=Coraliomargarita parva TaxID=3014050 RepID=UPI0022B36DF2|nr:hypothetical protein [Coraliomargarita parva]